MDKSKLAQPGTKIKYDLFKENYGQDGMSRRVEQQRNFCDCCCEKECKCDKSLDDTLNPPNNDDEGIVPCCC